MSSGKFIMNGCAIAEKYEVSDVDFSGCGKQKSAEGMVWWAGEVVDEFSGRKRRNSIAVPQRWCERKVVVVESEVLWEGESVVVEEGEEEEEVAEAVVHAAAEAKGTGRVVRFSDGEEEGERGVEVSVVSDGKPIEGGARPLEQWKLFYYRLSVISIGRKLGQEHSGEIEEDEATDLDSEVHRTGNDWRDLAYAAYIGGAPTLKSSTMIRAELYYDEAIFSKADYQIRQMVRAMEAEDRERVEEAEAKRVAGSEALTESERLWAETQSQEEETLDEDEDELFSGCPRFPVFDDDNSEEPDEEDWSSFDLREELQCLMDLVDRVEEDLEVPSTPELTSDEFSDSDSDDDEDWQLPMPRKAVDPVIAELEFEYGFYVRQAGYRVMVLEEDAASKRQDRKKAERRVWW